MRRAAARRRGPCRASMSPISCPESLSARATATNSWSPLAVSTLKRGTEGDSGDKAALHAGGDSLAGRTILRFGPIFPVEHEDESVRPVPADLRSPRGRCHEHLQ